MSKPTIEAHYEAIFEDIVEILLEGVHYPSEREAGLGVEFEQWNQAYDIFRTTIGFEREIEI